MKLVSSVVVGYVYETGGEKHLALIVSDETPASLTVTGADVDGLNDNDVVVAGSTLLTPGANYIAFEDGVFTEKE